MTIQVAAFWTSCILWLLQGQPQVGHIAIVQARGKQGTSNYEENFLLSWSLSVHQDLLNKCPALDPNKVILHMPIQFSQWLRRCSSGPSFPNVVWLILKRAWCPAFCRCNKTKKYWCCYCHGVGSHISLTLCLPPEALEMFPNSIHLSELLRKPRSCPKLTN